MRVLYLAFLFVVTTTMQLSAQRSGLPVLIKGPVPAFSLTGEDGKTYSEKALSGKVTVIYPYFVGCATTCPLLQANLVYPLFQRHGNDQNFQAFGFNIDPLDTPAAMRTQKRGLGDYARWHFLVYNQTATWTLANHFGFSINNRLRHSNAAVLVDGSGNVRARYDGTPESLTKFQEAVAALLN